MEPSHPVVHIVSFPLQGHVMHPNSNHAPDCWCEPARIYWVQNKWGIRVMIVEHNDYTAAHRKQQLADQEAGVPEQLAWINHALYDPEKYPTAAHRDIQARGHKQLPPHEGDSNADS